MVFEKNKNAKSVTITSVEGNTQRLDGGAMFGNAPRVVWEKWHAPDELGRIVLSCRSLLVELGGKKILLEAGIGAFFEPKLKERYGVVESRHVLLDNLESMGMSDSDIDMIILSHLHFDHAGGLLSSYEHGAELLFPNAKFIVGNSAFERSLKPHSRDRASYIPGLSQKLEDSGRLILVEKDSVEFGPSIRFWNSDGHTPGQMHTILEGQNEKLIFAGDLIPGNAWLHLPITMGYDRFAEKVIDEKEEFYSSLVDDKTWLFFTHDPDVVASKITMNKKGRVIPNKSINKFVKYQL